MAYVPIYGKLRTEREIRKCVPATPPGVGTTSVADGREELIYSVEIDTDGMSGMALTAAKNKSGVCNDGILRVRILERRRL